MYPDDIRRHVGKISHLVSCAVIHGFSALYSGVKEFLNVSASCACLFFNQSNQSVCFALNFGEITSRAVSGFAVNVFFFSSHCRATWVKPAFAVCHQAARPERKCYATLQTTTISRIREASGRPCSECERTFVAAELPA